MPDNKKSVKYNKFMCDLYNCLYSMENDNKNIVILCIGTNKMIGDCFGPLVGEKLKEKFSKGSGLISVYGDLENPIVFDKIKSVLKGIRKKYKNPYIISVDAALASESNVGKIIVKKKAIGLGKSLKTNEIKVGDISIRGIIGKDYKNYEENVFSLQSTSLYMVNELACIVGNGIIEVFRQFE